MVYITSFLAASTEELPAAPYIRLDAGFLKSVRERYSLRRADRYTLLGVASCLRLSELAPIRGDGECALITVSAFGPHRTVFDLLDDILDYPEDEILPTRFSHSVHNGVANYLSSAFGIKGASFALAGFENIWGEGVLLASTLLETGMCRNVLVAGIEENALLTEHLPSFWRERFPKRKPEGVALLLLSSLETENRLGVLSMDSGSAEDGIFHFGLEKTFFDSLSNATPSSATTLFCGKTVPAQKKG